MIASCTSFTLPHNQLVIFVKGAANVFKSVGQLSEVWVLVEDVPAEYRSVPFLMAFGIMVGKPIEVDGESLAMMGPFRLKVWCVDPVCLHGPVDVFPSANGIRLRSERDGLGPEVQDVLKQNAPKDDVQHVEAEAAAINEKSAPVGTAISGVCSDMPVRPMSPSKSGNEDTVGSPTRDVLALVSKKKKSTIRKFSAKSRAASGSKTTDVGVSINVGFGSPSIVLAIIQAKEVSQAAIAKAKDLVVANGIVATSAGVDVGVTGDGQSPLHLPRGASLRVPNPVLSPAGRVSA
ncbi:hypothetical protein D1007_51028 [Hordeum vulgare]|nr:hypothetical protein D1007_51028 [Hordeum vulgare]